MLLLANKLTLCVCSYDVVGRHGVWLRLISDWLGAEFACLRTTINQHVETFKADHIDHISQLPSPRTTVSRLFPHCMILLMLRWMAADLPVGPTQSERGLGPSGVWSYSESDHNYTADDSPGSELFSFIQLILEFANGCLVSGIAHVLYPRLLQAQL